MLESAACTVCVFVARAQVEVEVEVKAGGVV